MSNVVKPMRSVVGIASGGSKSDMNKVNPKKSIRIHGSGNYIMITEYSQASKVAKKRIGKREDIHNAVRTGVPIWVDTQRLSKLQLGSVIGAIEATGEVKKELVKRNGRPMILVRKMQREE